LGVRHGPYKMQGKTKTKATSQCFEPKLDYGRRFHWRSRGAWSVGGRGAIGTRGKKEKSLSLRAWRKNYRRERKKGLWTPCAMKRSEQKEEGLDTGDLI